MSTVKDMEIIKESETIIKLDLSDNKYDNSSIHWKKDIKPLKIGLNFINDLKPCSFRWKSEHGDDGFHRFGLIAQELEFSLLKANHENFCDLVKKDEIDHLKYYVKYESLIPVLIKAVQELTNKVEHLECTVNEKDSLR